MARLPCTSSKVQPDSMTSWITSLAQYKGNACPSQSAQVGNSSTSTSRPEKKTEGSMMSGTKGKTCPSWRANVDMKMPSITEAMARSQTTTNSVASVSSS